MARGKIMEIKTKITLYAKKSGEATGLKITIGTREIHYVQYYLI